MNESDDRLYDDLCDGEDESISQIFIFYLHEMVFWESWIDEDGLGADLNIKSTSEIFEYLNEDFW